MFSDNGMGWKKLVERDAKNSFVQLKERGSRWKLVGLKVDGCNQ
jgi:hypothetical protein